MEEVALEQDLRTGIGQESPLLSTSITAFTAATSQPSWCAAVSIAPWVNRVAGPVNRMSASAMIRSSPVPTSVVGCSMEPWTNEIRERDHASEVIYLKKPVGDHTEEVAGIAPA